MSTVDLHLHSTASDGRFSPAEIVRKSAAMGLTVIALADHDTVDGVAPAMEVAEAFPQLRVIPCVEISTDVAAGEVHILGYFVDCSDHELQTVLKRMLNSRRERIQKMITKLKNLGIYIDWQRVQHLAGDGSIGRPHVALAILEKGYINSINEAFDKYIGRGCPAYVKRQVITPIDAVELVLRADGLPVLAHPLTISELEKTIVGLKSAGLVGIEVYYNGYTAEKINGLIGLAGRYNLITTGGSDYHGLDGGKDIMIGSVDVPIESARRLIAMAEQRV